MAEGMDEGRMAAILDAYGADPGRWPAAERDAARAWLTAHPDRLVEARAEAQIVDAALARDRRDDAASPALEMRVRAGIPGAGETVTPFRPPSRAPRTIGAIAALAACAVLGVVLGFSNAATGEDSTADADAAFGAAFDVAAPGGEG